MTLALFWRMKNRKENIINGISLFQVSSSELFSHIGLEHNTPHRIKTVIHYFKLIDSIQNCLVNLPPYPVGEEREETTTNHWATHYRHRSQLSFPKKEYSVAGNRRELATNAHKGLWHFSPFNSFSLLMAEVSNTTLISRGFLGHQPSVRPTSLQTQFVPLLQS